MDKKFRQWYVFALDDYVCHTAARMAVYASASCFPVVSADITFKKHRLREIWNQLCTQEIDFPLQKVSHLLVDENDALPLTPQGKKFIVKPDAYAGSVGVIKTNTFGVSEAIVECRKILQSEAANPEMTGIEICGDVLVEAVIERKADLGACAEFTAHFISLQGCHQLVGIAEKGIDPITFIETAHIYPSPSFPTELIPVMEKATTQLLTQLRVQNTISNWEFIITPDDLLVMVEGQLRPSGDKVMELIGNVHGSNIYKAFFEALKEGRQAAIPVAIRSSVICWPAPEKVLERIEWLKLPETLPILVKLFIDRQALLGGGNWPGPVSWYQRHIAVMATGKDAKEAISKCRKTLKGIRLKVGKSTVGLIDPFI
jgi:hypothetical protein